MSLLDGGAFYEDILVFPQEVVTDEDGNIRTQPSATGQKAQARFQTMNQSGTSARLTESENEGFESQDNYEMRFPRGIFENLGAQSEIEWGLKQDGVTPQRWAVFGTGTNYNNSPRTRHVTYQVKRY